jgi:4'-phosphopantetheinyl transferase
VQADTKFHLHDDGGRFGTFRIPFSSGGKDSACGLALVETRDFNQFSPEKWLSISELERFNSIGSEKIKIQFACGRMAAKTALAIFENVARSNVDVDIANDGNGKPIVSNSAYEVSISHSGEWSVGLAFPKEFAFGVDVEQMRENRLNALKYINHESEPIPNNLQSLTVAWTMKEALSKALGLGFNLPFQELAIANFWGKDCIFECEFTKHKAFRGLAISYGNISLAMVYEKKCLWNCDIHQLLSSLRSAA